MTALVEVVSSAFDGTREMSHFVAGRFMPFSLCKLLNPIAFADDYAMYDSVAASWRAYGFLHTFLAWPSGWRT